MLPRVVPMVASDIPTMFRIRDEALIPTRSPISYLLFRPAFSQMMWDREIQRLENDTSMLFLKVMDNSGGTMIACLRAHIVSRPKNEEEIRMSSMIPPWKEDCGVGQQAWELCWRTMTETKERSFENRAHIYLGLMATLPSHQRQGAARALLDKLLETADGADLYIFLVSTDSAQSVYAKVGFIPVKEIILDLSKFGQESLKERFIFMIKTPMTGKRSLE